MSFLSLAIFIFILFTLVVIHELGHFTFAKLMKMRVDEFAFGFPPKIISKKIGETNYVLNSLPLGGYVKIFGEQTVVEKTEQDKKDEHRSFENKSVVARLLVLSGGVLFNIVACVILLAFGLVLGTKVMLSPEEVKNTNYDKREVLMISVREDSNLYKQGLRQGDAVESIVSGKNKLEKESLSSEAVINFVKQNENELIQLNVINALNQKASYAAMPQAGIVEGKKVLGIGVADLAYKSYYLPEAFIKAGKDTIIYTQYIFAQLGALITGLFFGKGNVSESLSGPVGMAVATKNISQKPISDILYFAALISLSLAVFNILPIPALDGGRILFVLFETHLNFFFKRRISRSIEQTAHAIGFLSLMALMLFVTYFDILKIFN